MAKSIPARPWLYNPRPNPPYGRLWGADSYKRQISIGDTAGPLGYCDLATPNAGRRQLNPPKFRTGLFHEFGMKKRSGRRLSASSSKVSQWWDWVENVDMLFSADKRHLSFDFQKCLQPVFDRLKLGVALSKIAIRIPSGKNETIGYLIKLRQHPITSPFYETLGTLLHELGHVVQEVNISKSVWSQKLWYWDEATKELVRRTDWEAQIAAIWDLNQRDKNWASDAYGMEEERYRQDPYLRDMPLEVLARNHLLGPFPLDAQCNRFADLLLALPGKPGR